MVKQYCTFQKERSQVISLIASLRTLKPAFTAPKRAFAAHFEHNSARVPCRPTVPLVKKLLEGNEHFADLRSRPKVQDRVRERAVAKTQQRMQLVTVQLL